MPGISKSSKMTSNCFCCRRAKALRASVWVATENPLRRKMLLEIFSKSALVVNHEYFAALFAHR